MNERCIMEIYRRRTSSGGKFHLEMKANVTDSELAIIKSSNLSNYKIQLYDGSLIGKSFNIVGAVGAFKSQISRIKTRWSAALVRTTGFVLIDTALLYVELVVQILKFLARLIIGRRKTAMDLIHGVKFSSRRVEDLKEKELFIFVSVAAIERAIQYAESSNDETTFTDGDYLKEIRGFDFAGGDGASDQVDDSMKIAEEMIDDVHELVDDVMEIARIF
jgi:hypothetical protein